MAAFKESEYWTDDLDMQIPRDPKRRAAFHQFIWLINDKTCFWCGQLVPQPGVRAKDPCSIEHVIPWSEGGPDCLWNLAVSHRSCNSRAGTSRTIDDIIRQARNVWLCWDIPKHG